MNIQEIVNAHIRDGQVHRGAMIRALQEREDEMADRLRLAGAQFGLYPFIVAEVLAEVGVGTPLTPEARQMIRQNFLDGMEQLRREHGGDN